MLVRLAALLITVSGCAMLGAHDYVVRGTTPPQTATCVATTWPALDATFATFTGVGAIASASFVAGARGEEVVPIEPEALVIFGVLAVIETVVAVRGFHEGSCPDPTPTN